VLWGFFSRQFSLAFAKQTILCIAVRGVELNPQYEKEEEVERGNTLFQVSGELYPLISMIY
jgi:hypothetical protein